jgi:hypothetical protein
VKTSIVNTARSRGRFIRENVTFLKEISGWITASPLFKFQGFLDFAMWGGSSHTSMFFALSNVDACDT